MPQPKFSKGGLVTDDERAEIIRLHGEGHGRNEIARLTRRSQRTVSVICAEEHLVFDVTQTEEATRHRVAQLAEKRVILADAFTDDALHLSAQVWQPATIHSFGGKEHTYNSRDLDEPLAADKRALMAAATNAAAQSLRLVPPVDDAGADDARSMLGKLMSGLAAVYEEQRGADEEAEGGSP
ncbi:helix-turn-helix domain-containing protein [Streptomyces sp. NPDC002795]|uniref:helix-turn-helix domain-containing protein n=1 Tax=Streptomyces sp. NPDC002795 TaxID=3364665 RepID=UPI00367D2CE9